MNANCYDNRELSWLKFNQRVLEEARDEANPLCERLSFLSIFQSNLDEFFMVRCGSLYDQMCEEPHFRENKTNMTCKEQLTAIYARVRELLRDKDDAYSDLRAELSMQGVDIVDFHTITTEEAAWLEAYFKAEIEPLLSPQIIGKKQPFPFLQNKNIYAVVVLEKKGTEKLGIVPCSSGVFPKIVSLPTGKNRFILSEELILHFAPEIFSRHTIKSKSLIRIIRNADIEPDERMEEECDYREAMEQLIRDRKKLCPIKLEFSRLMDTAVIHSLCAVGGTGYAPPQQVPVLSAAGSAEAGMAGYIQTHDRTSRGTGPFSGIPLRKHPPVPHPAERSRQRSAGRFH